MPAARRPLAADDLPSGRPPLSSWYTQGPSDGFGDRLLMFDNQATGPLELLRIRTDFAFNAEFEMRLRARINRLSEFAHDGFAEARAVEHLENGEGLTVVSTHVPGTRLSEIFPAARTHAGMHVTAARWVLGELTASLAALHGRYSGFAHGALAAERVVVTADRQVVITDYVFGDALAAMHLPSERLWKEFGIVSPPQRDLVPLDQKNDVVQLALITMALIRGSRISPEEYERQRTHLLDEFSAACDREMPISARALRAWMERALDANGFRSAVEADRALVELVNPLRVSARASRGASTPSAADPLPVQPVVASTESTSTALARHVESSTELDAARRPMFRIFPWIAAALAVIGIVQGAVIAGLVFRSSPSAAPPAAVPTSASQPASAVSDPEPVRPPESAAAPAAPLAVSRPGAVIASSGNTDANQNGSLRIESSVVVQVLEGSRLLGTSAAPISLAPGSHDLTFVNNSLSVRTSQTVKIAAGRAVSLAIALPDGRLNANAQPWAQVLVDGKPIGDTPLANIAVTVGEHEITFKHPQLGERRQRILVQAGVLTRVSATFTP